MVYGDRHYLCGNDLASNSITSIVFDLPTLGLYVRFPQQCCQNGRSGHDKIADVARRVITALMTRDEAVQSLIRCDQPLETVRASIEVFDWDWKGGALALLDMDAVASVLRRYVAGGITSEEVETWANLLEGREDIDFEPKAGAAIFDLANPALQGPTDKVASVLLNSI